MANVMTPNQFVDKFTETKGGQSFIYFTGSLVAERSPNTDAARSVVELGDIAYDYAVNKCLGFLTQRHAGFNIREYIFTKVKDKAKEHTNFEIKKE